MSAGSRLPALGPRERVVLLALLLVGGALRFSGLGQGIPFNIGVDEPEILERAVRMMRTGDFHPDFFDYPTLYIYVQAAVATVRFLAGAMGGLWATLDQAPSSEFYLWGRAVTAAIGTATIAVVVLIARRLGVVAGWTAGLIFAVQPMHVRESHYVLTDVPVTFFVALTLLLTLRAHEQLAWRGYLWAGAAAGLAAATKYHGGSALLLPLLTLVMHRYHPDRARAATAAIAGAAAAFLLFAPYTLLDLPAFLNGFGRLSHMYAVGPAAIEPAWLVYLKHLRINLGWLGLGFGLLSLGFAVTRAWSAPASERATWATAAAFVVIGFWLIAGQRLVWARYLLPLLPPLAVLMGGTLAALAAALARRGLPAQRRALVFAIVMAAVLAQPAINAVGWTRMNARTGTAELTYRWILANVPAGSRTAVETRFLLLPPDRYPSENMPRLIDRDVTAFRAEGFQYLVASSQSFGEPLHAREPSDATRAYRALFDRLELLTTIAPSATHPGEEWRIYRVPPG